MKEFKRSLQPDMFAYQKPTPPATTLGGIKLLFHRPSKERIEIDAILQSDKDLAEELQLAQQHMLSQTHRSLHLRATELVNSDKFKRRTRRKYATEVEDKKWKENRDKFVRTNAHAIVSAATSAHWFRQLSEDLACVPSKVAKGELTPCQTAARNVETCESALFSLVNTLQVRIDTIGSTAKDNNNHAHHVTSPGVYDAVTGEKIIFPETERKTVKHFEAKRPETAILMQGLECAQELRSLLK